MLGPAIMGTKLAESGVRRQGGPFVSYQRGAGAQAYILYCNDIDLVILDQGGVQ
jgi:hypothetical protein